MINFINKEKGNLIKIVQANYPSLSYSTLNACLRKKDVKVDGKRVSQDVKLNGGENIVIYNPKTQIKIVYQDDNILVCHKPYGVETTSKDKCYQSNSLEEELNCFACHRLDMNTEGLVIMAKSEHVQKILFEEIKNRNIKKFYLALVYGVFEKQEDTLNDYLIKEDDKVRVVSVNQKSAENIITNYKVLKEFDNNTSLVQVELVTGKTHQIRAHMAYIGHFVIGDNKYGKKEINKTFKYKKQCLCATKLKFCLQNEELKYLNDLTFETQPSFLK